MPNVNGKKKRNRTKDADRSDERKTDRSSLDRLADFARRILTVSKKDLKSANKDGVV